MIATQRRDTRRDFVLMVLMAFTVSGIFGFIYEELFYRVDLGYFVKRGSGFGPWIDIYGLGGAAVLLATERIRSQPWLVFWTSAVLCGALEFAAGYAIFHLFHARPWDYNVEIWNWGNIGGYVCARSVLVFAASALLLQYAIRPALERFIRRSKPRAALLWAVVPAGIFALDCIVGITRTVIGYTAA